MKNPTIKIEGRTVTVRARTNSEAQALAAGLKDREVYALAGVLGALTELPPAARAPALHCAEEILIARRGQYEI